MRLAKHKLPKEVNKKTQSAKHKKSPASIAKRIAKVEKKNRMDTDDVTEDKPDLTDEQKAIAKLQRKSLNAHKSMYKKQNLNRTHFNGPRAVTK